MTKTDSHFTKEHLQSLFEYKDGNLFWKEKKGIKLPGALAGTPSHHYSQICIDYKIYRTHRLIWAYHHGPSKFFIDHINGNTFDNHIENLRECTICENQHNRKVSKNNKSGVKGVSWSNQKQKWRARVLLDGKEVHVGFFNSIDDAKASIDAARNELHKGFARNN